MCTHYALAAPMALVADNNCNSTCLKSIGCSRTGSNPVHRGGIVSDPRHQQSYLGCDRR
jgi:hypothetical protein